MDKDKEQVEKGYRFKDEKKQHLHQLDGRPLYGTTTLIGEVFPPPLAWWGSGMALEKLGFISPNKEPDKEKRIQLALIGKEEAIRASNMVIEDYMDWLDEQYRNHDNYKKSKGKTGIDTHKLIESYIKLCMSSNECRPYSPEDTEGNGIESFIKWAYKDVDRFIWSEANCYSKALWVGGQTDFGFIHKDGRVIIGDAKPSIYPKNFIQTAGYGLQIKENGLLGPGGNQIKITGIDQIDGYLIFDYNDGDWRYRTDVERLESYFKLAVDLYKNRKVVGTKELEAKS